MQKKAALSLIIIVLFLITITGCTSSGSTKATAYATPAKKVVTVATTAQVTEAVGNVQAALKAKQYLRTMAFSRDGLIKQLEFEGFTNQQAVYGVQSVGY